MIIRKPDSLWGIIYPPVIAVILEAFCEDYNKVNEPILSLTCGKSSCEASTIPSNTIELGQWMKSVRF